jgi:hypothetical protein
MSPEKLKEFLVNLNEPYFYMPPWCGREEEAEVLAEFLATLAPPWPQNLPRAAGFETESVLSGEPTGSPQSLAASSPELTRKR